MCECISIYLETRSYFFLNYRVIYLVDGETEDRDFLKQF